jgi:acetyltransferase-like isoleucine patch superfamily enzyme
VSIVDRAILSIKRRDNPAARLAHDAYRRLMSWNLPDSAGLRSVYSSLYFAHDAVVGAIEWLGGKFVYEPMLRSRAEVGPGLRLSALPYISGHARISIGSNCSMGKFTVLSGRYIDEPELVIGDECTVGTDVYFSVSKSIRIGNHVAIAKSVTISDGDGHPSELARRMRDEPLQETDLGPIVIEDWAWIGRDAHILKGVRIGKGAIVAAGSVVAADVPPETLAMGVPARIVKSRP